jgi:hypothetical protein
MRGMWDLNPNLLVSPNPAFHPSINRRSLYSLRRKNSVMILAFLEIIGPEDD